MKKMIMGLLVALFVAGGVQAADSWITGNRCAPVNGGSTSLRLAGAGHHVLRGGLDL